MSANLDTTSRRLRQWTIACLGVVGLGGLLVLAGCAGDGDGGFVVAGDVITAASGDVYARLLTREQYDGAPGTFAEQVLPAAELAGGRIAFAFDSIPAGTYTVDVYQDVNGNGRLDEGSRGPTEPVGNFTPAAPPGRRPTFDEVSFVLDRDHTDIALALAMP